MDADVEVVVDPCEIRWDVVDETPLAVITGLRPYISLRSVLSKEMMQVTATHCNQVIAGLKLRLALSRGN